MTEVDRSTGEEAFVRLFDPAVADDPHATYAAMRTGCPVVRANSPGRRSP